MDILTSLLLALGLAMDAFAVSISDGMCYGELSPGRRLSIPLLFGVFQGLMPVLGSLAGSVFSDVIMRWDHWIAFGLLSMIGVRMTAEALREMRCTSGGRERVFSFRLVLLQAVATSIDALAVGVSFALVGANAYQASAIIAAVTFICSLVGVSVGRRFGGMLRGGAEIAGGLMLIGIGLKILIEHLG